MMSKTFIANEIFSLRKVKKNLENRVKNLEIENHDLVQKLYPGSFTKFKEPKRAIIEMNSQTYNNTNVAMRTIEKFNNFDNSNLITIENSPQLRPFIPKKGSQTADNDRIISHFNTLRMTPETTFPEISDTSFISFPKSEKNNYALFSNLYMGKSKPNSTIQNVRRNEKRLNLAEDLKKGDVSFGKRNLIPNSKLNNIILF